MEADKNLFDQMLSDNSQERGVIIPHGEFEGDSQPLTSKDFDQPYFEEQKMTEISGYWIPEI